MDHELHVRQALVLVCKEPPECLFQKPGSLKRHFLICPGTAVLAFLPLLAFTAP